SRLLPCQTRSNSSSRTMASKSSTLIPTTISGRPFGAQLPNPMRQMTMRSSAIGTLETLLQRKNSVGARLAVPVLGDGLNIHALRKDGWRKGDEWSSVLRRTAAREGVSAREFEHLPQSTPLLWDVLAERAARQRRTNLDVAELELRQRLIHQLSLLES